ncbi:uncharacterized protein [Clytia hemisphaerica]
MKMSRLHILLVLLSCAVFCKAEEHEIKAGSIIKHVPTLGNSYSIDVDIKLTGISTRFSNILSATFNNRTRKSPQAPSIYVRKNSTDIMLFNSLNNKHMYLVNKSLPLNEYVNIKIRQAKMFDGTYHYMVLVDGQKIFSAINSNPVSFENVTYYASKPRVTQANAMIRNFKIHSPIPDTYFKAHKGQLVRFIRRLQPSYKFTFTINPLGYIAGESNILRVTNTEQDCCNHGDRIPGLFFAPNSTNLLIRNAINGNGNQLVNKTIPLYHTTYVTILQRQYGQERYRYSISINATEIYRAINNRFVPYDNVTVWMSDKFHTAANVIVDRFEYQTPIPEYGFQYQPAMNTFHDEIPYISKAYKFEFQVKLNGTSPFMTNILQVTSRPLQNYRATVTSVEVQPNSASLKIRHRVGLYKKNRSFSLHIGSNRFMRVRIMQFLDCNDKYRFSIYFNNVEVFSLTNTRPREFFNSVVFFGAPRKRAATNSIIRNYSFINL